MPVVVFATRHTIVRLKTYPFPFDAVVQAAEVQASAETTSSSPPSEQQRSVAPRAAEHTNTLSMDEKIGSPSVNIEMSNVVEARGGGSCAPIEAREARSQVECGNGRGWKAARGQEDGARSGRGLGKAEREEAERLAKVAAKNARRRENREKQLLAVSATQIESWTQRHVF